jgi:hypothetical protein
LAETLTSKGQGDFFAVDCRAWARACSLGINAAVAYLMLARGTGADNRTSTWSVQAIETYTSISRGRAQEALKSLRQAGLIQVLRQGTRPKYRLAPAHQVLGCEGYRRPLDDVEQLLVDLLVELREPCPTRATKEWGYRSPKAVAQELVDKGWLKKVEGGGFATADEGAAVQPDWIWLPNELVTGAAAESSPVERVRQTQDVMTLRLLVDLYHVQNLRDDGGVSRNMMWQKYERHKVGSQAQFTIWGFLFESSYVCWSGPASCHQREKLTKEEKDRGKTPGVDWFRRTEQLERLGLIEWVPHLVESDGPEGEIIHPLGKGETSRLEDVLGASAGEAASAMLTSGQRSWAAERGMQLAPVLHHVANVQLIGIARLRYRPRTRKTAAWWADLQAKGERHLNHYRELTEVRARAVNA